MNPPSTSRPTSTPRTYHVTFKAVGDAKNLYGRWRYDGNTNLGKSFDAPWEKTVTFDSYYIDRGGSGLIEFTVIRDNRILSRGALRCEIWVDGELKDSKIVPDGAGASGAAKCTYELTSAVNR